MDFLAVELEVVAVEDFNATMTNFVLKSKSKRILKPVLPINFK